MPKLNAETFTGPMFLFGASLVAMGSMVAVVLQTPSSANDKARVSLPAPPTTLAGETTTSATIPADTTPPPIFVAAGLDGSTVNTTTVSLSGTTEPGATLTLGGANVAVDPTGAWATPVTLAVGPNTFAIVAADAAGNTSTKTVIVTYTEATTTTSSTTESPASSTSTTAKPKPKPTVPPTTAPPPPDTGP